MTYRQLRALIFVEQCLAVSGLPPTYDEIGAAIGCSKTNAFAVVSGLIKHGYLIKTAGKRTLARTTKAIPGLDAGPREQDIADILDAEIAAETAIGEDKNDAIDRVQALYDAFPGGRRAILLLAAAGARLATLDGEAA